MAAVVVLSLSTVGGVSEPLPDLSLGLRYCSDTHRQAAYLDRCRPVPEGSEAVQQRAQMRSLKNDRRLLEVQLQGAKKSAADAAREAAQYDTMWDRMVRRSNGLLVFSLSAVEEEAERLRTDLETSGVRTACRSGYNKGHMDAEKQMAQRADVDYLTVRAQMAGYGDGPNGRTKLTRQDMLPRH